MSWFALGTSLHEALLGVIFFVALSCLSGRFALFVRFFLTEKQELRHRVFFLIFFGIFSALSLIFAVDYTALSPCHLRPVGAILAGFYGGPWVGLGAALIAVFFGSQVIDGMSAASCVPVLVVGFLAGILKGKLPASLTGNLGAVLLVLLYYISGLLLNPSLREISAAMMPPVIFSFMANVIGIYVFLHLGEQLRRDRRKLYILENLALTDGLTGLYNHRYFQERLQKEIERVSRQTEDGQRAELALIFIDVDLFKTYNDTYGHQAGDRVLQELSSLFKRNIRSHDVACRYGGEEFAIILPDTNRKMACEVAERLRASIAKHVFVTPQGEQTKVTISGGVSAAAPDDAKESLLQRADRALYEAKKQKNFIECNDDTSS